MQVVTTAEARESLPELLQQIDNGPVMIRDGERDVALLVSPASFDNERLSKVRAFERVRDAAARELAANLAREGITEEQFLKELLG